MPWLLENTFSFTSPNVPKKPSPPLIHPHRVANAMTARQGKERLLSRPGTGLPTHLRALDADEEAARSTPADAFKSRLAPTRSILRSKIALGFAAAVLVRCMESVP